MPVAEFLFLPKRNVFKDVWFITKDLKEKGKYEKDDKDKDKQAWLVIVSIIVFWLVWQKSTRFY